VLQGINLAVAPGQIVALLGHNGAGKTTLLECLAGAIRPSSGEVFWFGRRATRNVSDRRLLGFLGHENGLYPELTAQENLLFAGRMYGRDDAAGRIRGLLNRVGLSQWADRRVCHFSQGMRQRLALARAMIHDPPILLLDEPFGNLDAENRIWLETTLEEHRRRHAAVCFTSHDPQQCRRLADQLVHLQSGRIRQVEEVSRQHCEMQLVGAHAT
jgi:heme ABC exporter ATP-binding subunit CcmA